MLTAFSRPRRASSALWLAALALISVPVEAAGERFERVLARPCRALALDREPNVAALTAESVWVQDRNGAHDEPLPAALRGDMPLRVFFGRDYRVRVVGNASTKNGLVPRYFRSLSGQLRPAPDELGALGKSTPPGIVAVLGTSDPEVVCRLGEACLIKRMSGWKRLAAPSGLELVGLSLGSAWALALSQLYVLRGDFVPFGEPGPWQHADDALVRGDRACVVERARNRVHHYHSNAWHSSASPIAGPRSLFGTENSTWFAGDGGLARGSQQGLSQVEAAPPQIRAVLGRSDEDLWLCSEQGLFHSLNH